jgi:hypothetical protein
MPGRGGKGAAGRMLALGASNSVAGGLAACVGWAGCVLFEPQTGIHTILGYALLQSIQAVVLQFVVQFM